MTQEQIYSECERIYNQIGQHGVYNFILHSHPELKWGWCDPCEDETPTVIIDETPICCVCGTYKKEEL